MEVKEYESEIIGTLTEFSYLLQEYIKEYEKLLNLIYPDIAPELKREFGNKLYALQLRILTLISGLDLLAKIYNIEWHGRGDWSMFTLEQLGKQVVKFLMHI